MQMKTGQTAKRVRERRWEGKGRKRREEKRIQKDTTRISGWLFFPSFVSLLPLSKLAPFTSIAIYMCILCVYLWPKIPFLWVSGFPYVLLVASLYDDYALTSCITWTDTLPQEVQTPSWHLVITFPSFKGIHAYVHGNFNTIYKLLTLQTLCTNPPRSTSMIIRKLDQKVQVDDPQVSPGLIAFFGH